MTDVFSYTPEHLAALAEQVLTLAREHGASQAQVSVSQSKGLSLQLRQNRVLSRVRETHSRFSLTVFNGKKQGSVFSTNLGFDALEESVKAACAIARYTDEDPAAGLASAELLCDAPRDLDLFHRWDLREDQAVSIAQRIESGLTSIGGCVQSEGAWVSSNHSFQLIATSEGFSHGVAKTLHSLSAMALARNDTHSELDYWSESATDPTQLPSAEDIGRKAGLGAGAYLDQRPLGSRRSAILFDPLSAISLLDHLTQAISSDALYTDSSFLKDQLGKAVMPEHLSVYEDPFIAKGTASFSFDNDGIAPQQRYLVEDGVLRGYLLSLYGARRLNSAPTGNGSGPGNLLWRSSLTHPTDDLTAMLRKLGTGLFVTSLAGNGVRLFSGDYSRGVRGFWVENGQIQYAVTGATIAGNLKQMLHGIVAVGSDLITQGPFCAGSVLIDQMQISGQ